jgi:exopolysaccharide production protein ExoZ
MRQQRPRLDFIDALRGLAILGVLAIHTGQTVPRLPPILVSMTNFGSLGVQLFFMLSSLTLSSIYSPVSFSPTDFYLRRFFRIAPAFYLAGLFYSLSSPQEHASAHSILVTLTFVQIWFPDTVKCLVPGGWSISVEAAFYVAFPLIQSYLTSLKRAIIATAAAFLFATVYALAIRNQLGNTLPQESIDDFIYFGFVWNLPAFLLGTVLFHALPVVRKYPLRNRVFGAGLLLVCVLLVLAAIGVEPLARRSVSLILIAVMILLVGVTHAPVIVNRAMRQLGEISFSVYLVHFALLPLVASWVNPLFASASDLVRWGASFSFVLVGSSMISTLTWRLIEQPGITLGRQITSAFQSRKRPMAPSKVI